MLPAFRTVTELEKECVSAAEPEMKMKNLEFNNSIKFDRVNFSFKKGEDHFSIKNLNLNIPAGKTTALVGFSGAGKSTIVDLLIGFIRPQEGYVLIDEKPLKDEYLSSWRRKIGYVAQETFLFNDTIRNNLMVANPDANKNMLIESLKLASADELYQNYQINWIL